MRNPVETFSYTGILGEADVRPGEVSLLVCASDASVNARQLAGETPTLRFLDDKLVLIPAPLSSSHFKWCSFQIGDVVGHAARAGDRLTVSRDACDGLVVSLFRDQRLFMAVGALLGASLGPDVQVTSTGRRYPDPRLEIDIRGHTHVFLDRESATIEGFEVYVERGIVWDPWGEGPNESLSIAAVGDSVVMNSARRSAVLMADRYSDPLCGERTDGTMIKSRYLIG